MPTNSIIEQEPLYTQLPVGQEVIFVKGGQALDLLEPGTHTLRTGNIPFLNKLPKTQSVNTIGNLCNKLKQDGTLTFNLLDFDQLINFYQYQKLKLDDIVIHTKNIECFINKAEIIKMFHKHPQISIDSMTYDDMYAVYTLCRKSL